MSYDAMRWACELELPANEKTVLVQLAYRHNRETGQCNPSLERIAKDTGLSKSSVCVALRNLSEQSLIVRRQRFQEGAQTRTDYELRSRNTGVHNTDSPVQEADTPVRITDDPCPPAGRPLSATRTQTRNKNKEEEQGKEERSARLEIVHSNSGNKAKPKASFNPEEVELPEGLNRETWISFVQMRKECGKRIKSPKAVQALVRKLERFTSEGHDANLLIEKATEREWLSIFAGEDTKATPKPKRWEEVPPEELTAQWRADLGA